MRIFVSFVTTKQSIRHSNNLLNCDSPRSFLYVSQEAVNNDDIKNYHTGVSELTPYWYEQGSSHLSQLLFEFLDNLT